VNCEYQVVILLYIIYVIELAQLRKVTVQPESPLDAIECVYTLYNMNEHVKITDTTILSNNWYTLNKVTFDYLKKNGQWQTQHREAYDRGNGATILLYNKGLKTVVLTRQFRLPTYINGNETGMLIEACAGLLDKDNPEDCIRRETEEETGYKISHVQKVMEAYMSPGSVTEILYFFVAEYTKEMKMTEGGGLEHDQEDIEVLELSFDEALRMVDSGAIKDAKTIMLLQHARIHHLL
jgi:GDP-mannose pyrophosphatase NudK